MIETKDQTRNLKIIKRKVIKGRTFIFGEENNVAPNTPAENLNYAYKIVKQYGKYE